jgi:tetratricopeptide (TPR) repeat protein
MLNMELPSSSSGRPALSGASLDRVFVMTQTRLAAKFPSDPTAQELERYTLKMRQITRAATELRQFLTEKEFMAPFSCLGHFYLGQGEYTQAETWYQDGLTLAETYAENQDTDAVAHFISALSKTYWRQGRTDQAVEYSSKAFEILRTLKDASHPEVITQLINLAELSLETGFYAVTHDFLEGAVEFSAPLPDTQRTHFDAYLFKNAASLSLEQKEYRQAESYFKTALDATKEAHGEKDWLVYSCLNGLAIVNHALGNLDAAKSFFEESIELAQEVFGPRHREVATISSNLGVLHEILGDWETAESLYQEALDIATDYLGEAHPDVAVPMTRLGILYANQGHYVEAHSYLYRAFSLREASYGRQHSQVANSAKNLGRLYRKTGAYRRAEDAFLTSFEILNDLFGEAHPLVIDTLFELAELYTILGWSEQFEKSLQTALRLTQEVYREGASHLCKTHFENCPLR